MNRIKRLRGYETLGKGTATSSKGGSWGSSDTVSAIGLASELFSGTLSTISNSKTERLIAENNAKGLQAQRDLQLATQTMANVQDGGQRAILENKIAQAQQVIEGLAQQNQDLSVVASTEKKTLTPLAKGGLVIGGGLGIFLLVKALS